MRFCGAPRLAEQRARKFMQMQKTSTGWRKLSAAYEKEEEQEMYVDADKNKKMVRTEVLTKKLAMLLDRRPGGAKKTFPKRAAGKIFLDFVPLARIMVQNAEEYAVEWKIKLVAELRLHKEEIEAELKAAADMA